MSTTTVTQITVSARVTYRGIRYTAEHRGDDVGSLGYGDHIEVRHAISAAGVSAAAATEAILAAYNRRDREAVTLTVRPDGVHTVD